MAVVPDAENPGSNVLQMLRPEGVIGGHDDDCLCSMAVQADRSQPAGGLSVYRGAPFVAFIAPVEQCRLPSTVPVKSLGTGGNNL